jgi:restriction system protein
MLWPTLLALRDLGDSGSIQEIDDRASDIAGFSDGQLSVLHRDGPQTEVRYRMAWARSYLKAVGALENSSRGVWSITDYGRDLTVVEVAGIPARVRALFSRKPKVSTGSKEGESRSEKIGLIGDSTSPTRETEDEEDWRTDLLSALQAMHPTSFEKLCQRILRESGFTRVEVTGRSGDGGIDGVGVLRIALLSFQVSFQCKRYKGNVASSAIRDFRGAMVGRTGKGLFITTGSFTPDAKREATRDGAPVLDLIDGETLCDILKDKNLGVTTQFVEQVSINSAWFDSL